MNKTLGQQKQELQRTNNAAVRKLQVEIEGYAREYGLDFFSTLYEVVDYKQMNQAAAYVGFPSRYPH